MKKLKTLIVEDSVADQRRYVSFLESRDAQNFEFTFAPTLDQAEEVFQTEVYDLVILDYLLPDGSGLEFLRSQSGRIRSESTPIIMATSIGDEKIAVESLKCGAVDYIVKGKVDAETFKIAVDGAIRAFNLKTQLRLQNEELLDFKTLTERSSDFVLVISGNDLSILDANPSICEALGYAKEDMLQKKFSDLDSNFSPIESLESFLHKIKEHGSQKIETDLQRKDGTTLPAYLNFSFSSTSQGLKLIAIGHDLTERRKMNAIMQMEKEKALELADFKTQFLARMSHDIRTPLNSIIGMTDVLQESKIDEDQQRYLSTISTAGQGLLDLVNDILDITKIEAGEITLEEREFDLETILVDAIDIISVQARRAKTDVIVEKIPYLDSMVIGDQTRMKQIVMNLLNNAVKFTEGGEVILRAEVISNVLRISVKDNGIGIPQGKLSHIFEAYKQADQSMNRRFGGTGLGLSICKKLVEIMHGEIWVESDIGKGSVFTFEIPLYLGKKNLNTNSNTMLKDKNIFILTKTYSDAKYLESLITELGGHAEIFTEPNKALQVLPTKSYDLYLIDCKLNKQNGFHFVDAAQKIQDISRKIMLMLPAGGHRQSDVKQAELLGISTVLIKPIKIDYFTSAWKRLTGSLENQSILKTPIEKELGPLKVLVADDIESNRAVIEAYLKKTSCIVDFANNGRLAVESYLAKRHDVIFMDMYMPEMNGLEATKKIREEEQGLGFEKHTVIIALTANTFDESAKKMIHAGCDDFLTKPIRKRTVLEKLGEVNNEKPEVSIKVDDSFLVAGINRGVLDELFSIDEDGKLLADMIKAFLQQSETMFDRLRQDVIKRQIKSVTDLSHELGEMSGTLGAEKLAYSCWNLQSAAERGAFDGFAHFFKIVEGDFEKTTEFFRARLKS